MNIMGTLLKDIAIYYALTYELIINIGKDISMLKFCMTELFTVGSFY